MRPYKFLWDSIIRDGSEFVEEGASLEIEIQAVAKAKLLLALEGIGLNAERVFQAATALRVACHDLFADFLGKAESEMQSSICFCSVARSSKETTLSLHSMIISNLLF